MNHLSCSPHLIVVVQAPPVLAMRLEVVEGLPFCSEKMDPYPFFVKRGMVWPSGKSSCFKGTHQLLPMSKVETLVLLPVGAMYR